jgi:excisionase family DNA binding protein
VASSAEVPRLLLSTPEVARALGVSDRFVKQLIQAGTLPSLKVGRLRRVYAGDLHAWIDSQRATARPNGRGEPP